MHAAGNGKHSTHGEIEGKISIQMANGHFFNRNSVRTLSQRMGVRNSPIVFENFARSGRALCSSRTLAPSFGIDIIRDSEPSKIIARCAVFD